ncbi:hypothetical protein [Vibrio sp. MA40-2]|uniref:hypothetical protein n=1 Tax=Vibrio sp. MA40-2 TaxID=3391828 RepID=UPI0039A46CB6
MLGLLWCVSPLGYAADMAYVTFDVGDGEKYQSEILLPDMNTIEHSGAVREQLVCQSLHSVTLFTELQTKEKVTVPITKLVTYGLTLHSKVVDSSQDLYRFSLEYMGQPTLSISSAETNKIILKDSPEDIRYQVNFALQADIPVCNQVNKMIGGDDQFSSTLCITLHQTAL